MEAATSARALFPSAESSVLADEWRRGTVNESYIATTACMNQYKFISSRLR